MSGLGAILTSVLAEGLAQRRYSGASAAVSVGGSSVGGSSARAVVGTLTADGDEPVTPETPFDLASVSKIVTAMTVLRLTELGELDLDRPIADYLGRRLAAGLGSATLWQLLTHTSGLPSDSFIWRRTDLSPGERLGRVLATEPLDRPDAVHRYSCVGYVIAGAIAESVGGESLPALVERLVAAPAGARLRYGPVADAAATEDEFYLQRGVVRGEVHDELAWSLGGAVGNAGLFATAQDLLALGRWFLAGGLSEGSTRLMTTPQVPASIEAGFGQAIGFRVDDPAWMGDVHAVGHTGFTGTMIALLPEHETVVVLLTNRVHPSRVIADVTPVRRRLLAEVAASVAGT